MRVRHSRAVGWSRREGFQRVGGGAEFGDAGEGEVDGVAVSVGAAIGHGIGDEDDVIAVIVGAASGGFDADGGGDAGDENLSDLAAAEVGVEVGADERAGAIFGDEMIGGLDFEFGDKIGPVGRQRHFGADEVGAGGSGAGRIYVYENDGEISLAECARESGGAVDDFGHRMSAGGGDDSFLEIDDDQGGDGIELCEWHFFQGSLGEREFWFGCRSIEGGLKPAPTKPLESIAVFVGEMKAREDADGGDGGEEDCERDDVAVPDFSGTK